MEEEDDMERNIDDEEETSEVADVLPPFSVLSGCHSLCFHPSSEWRIKSIGTIRVWSLKYQVPLNIEPRLSREAN